MGANRKRMDYVRGAFKNYPTLFFPDRTNDAWAKCFLRVRLMFAPHQFTTVTPSVQMCSSGSSNFRKFDLLVSVRVILLVLFFSFFICFFGFRCHISHLLKSFADTYISVFVWFYLTNSQIKSWDIFDKRVKKTFFSLYVPWSFRLWAIMAIHNYLVSLTNV